MKTLTSIVAVFAAFAAIPAGAADPIKPSTRQLAELCAGCRLVTAVATESRKGKASGVGAVGGAVAGGVVGSKVGDSTAATVGGAVIGGVLGHQAERQLKKQSIWVVTTVGKDGKSQRHEFDRDPNLKAGDAVVPDGNTGLKRR